MPTACVVVDVARKASQESEKVLTWVDLYRGAKLDASEGYDMIKASIDCVSMH